MNLSKNFINENVSIIIPSRTIDSILVHSVRNIRLLYPDVAIILVVDYLTQENKNFNDKINNLFIKISDNPNMSYKRNLGVNIVTTKYIAFIDSDAYPKNGWLENAILFLENNFEYSAATGLQYNPPEDSFEQKCIRQARYSPFFNHKEWLIVIDEQAAEQDCNEAISANFIIKREDYIILGGMNPKIYLAEDNEFCYRLISSGRKIRFLPSAAIYHRERCLSAFFKQIYAISHYYSYTSARGFFIKGLKYSIFHFLPLIAFISYFLLITILFMYITHYWILIIIPLVIFLLFLVEAWKIVRKIKIHKLKGLILIFIIYIGFCVSWIIGSVWGLLNLPPTPYSTYKH